MMRTLAQYTISLTLVAAVVFGSLVVATPQTAHAQAGAAGCGASAAIGAGIAAATPFLVPSLDPTQWTETTKECFLDGIVILIREALIEVLVSSVVSWINSGFQGSPAFIGDLDRFLIDVADRAAGGLIQGSELSFLCSPFELDVRIALAIQYYAPFDDRVRCTLSDVVGNIDDFVDGTFREGGWRGWFELSARPHNNPYGAFLAADAELSARIRGAQDKELIELDWGEGFRGFTTCRDNPAVTETAGPNVPYSVPEQECVTGTPGTVINEQLNWSLSSGQRQLELADEIDEIIGALLGQLARQVLGGIGGLLGTSEASYGGGTTYLSRIRAERQAKLSDTQSDTQDYIEQQLSILRTVEARYREPLISARAAVERPAGIYADAAACWREKAEDATSTTDRERALDEAEEIDGIVVREITPRLTSLNTRIATADENLALLDVLEQEYDSRIQAADSAQEIQNIITEFNTRPEFSENGEFHTSRDVFDAGSERDSLQETMQNLEEDAQERLEECRGEETNE